MPGSNLTREEAQERAALLSVDSYDVALDLTTGPTTFTTRSAVQFSARAGSASFIDFVGESVTSITLNGESLDPATHFADSRVSLPDLAERNELVVEGVGVYMHTGEGLHRFVDPTDQEVYLYTQFEVADCRRAFPVFEQPDLKATFAFTVTAPARWELVSNEPTPQSTPAEQTYTNERGEHEPAATWAFPATPRLSCYVTALVAGPYDVVRDSVESRKGTIPLAIYTRKSLTQYLDSDNIFDCTKRGFDFYEREFDCDYPFTKYDQIFTPEFNAGAMENAGCVTFTETYVFRGKVTEQIIERRALTILHELAHMWFGDLVTMKWWDDLWLNESFAEWASTLCQAEATEWTTAWTTFGAHEKSWAYRQDQLSSTHPVYANIRDLEDVLVNFDGITYAKGASVLKHLVAYVGRDAFIAGLRSYFKKFAWQNTAFADLLTELEATSGRNLDAWTKAWLQTAGVNTLRPVLEVDGDGKYTSVVIEQSATEDYPTIRPHRIGVGLYTLQGDSLVRTGRFEIDVAGERTEVPELVGQLQPDLLLLNDEDLSYAKLRLDERSLRTALEHPTALADSLMRAQVQNILWDMTRDAEMGARTFIDFSLAALPHETDSTLRQLWLVQLQGITIGYVTHTSYGVTGPYVDPAHKQAVVDDVTRAMRAMAMAAEPGSDAQLQLVRTYGAFAHSADDAAYLNGLLDGTNQLAGLELDTDMRWSLLAALAGTDVLTEEQIAKQLASDPTATGRERAELVRAAYPSAQAKDAAWQRLTGEDLPNQTIAAIGAGFSRAVDATLLEPFAARYVEMLVGMWGARTHAIAELVAIYSFPIALANRELLDATNSWLEANADAPAGLVRTVAENRDQLQRALNAQQRDAQDS